MASSTAAESLAIQKAVVMLGERIMFDKIDCKSVYKLLSETWAIVSSNDHLDVVSKRVVFKKAVQRVGAGMDGISGTDDDIIPPTIVEKLVTMIDNGIIDDFIDVVDIPVKAIENARVEIQKIAPKIISIVKALMSCFLKK